MQVPLYVHAPINGKFEGQLEWRAGLTLTKAPPRQIEPGSQNRSSPVQNSTDIYESYDRKTAGSTHIIGNDVIRQGFVRLVWLFRSGTMGTSRKILSASVQVEINKPLTQQAQFSPILTTRYSH